MSERAEEEKKRRMQRHSVDFPIQENRKFNDFLSSFSSSSRLHFEFRWSSGYRGKRRKRINRNANTVSGGGASISRFPLLMNNPGKRASCEIGREWKTCCSRRFGPFVGLFRLACRVPNRMQIQILAAATAREGRHG